MARVDLSRAVGVVAALAAGLTIAACSASGGSSAGTTSSTPAPDDSGVTSTTLPSASAVEPPPSVFPSPDASFLASLAGMSQSAAEQAAAAAGFTTRVVSVDGVGRPVTEDYRSDRINLEIVGGKVTKATAG